MPTTYKCLATSTVSGTGSLTFSNIPQTYQDLAIHMSIRVNNASQNYQNVSIRPDSNATDGRAQFVTLGSTNAGSTTSTTSSGTSQIWQLPAPTSNNTINGFGFVSTNWLYIPFYLNTLFFKQGWMQVGTIRPNQSAVSQVYASGNYYSENGGAIDSLLIQFNSDAESGTIVSLYGIALP